MASEKAILAKNKGNTAFKVGDYPTAIGHYTSAILADSTDPTFPLNRAAAYLKLGKNKDAERDCTTVLTLNPLSAKAFYRRGQARLALDQLTDAQRDFKDALKLEPANDAVAQELHKLELAISQQGAKQGPAVKTVNRVQNVDSSAAQRRTTETPRRRRIPIQIVDPVEHKAPTPASHSIPAQVPVRITEAKTDDGDMFKPVSSRRISPSDASVPIVTENPGLANNPEPQPSVKKDTFEQVKQARDAKVTRNGGIFRQSGKHTLFATKENGKPSGSTTGIPAPSQESTRTKPETSKAMPTSRVSTPMTLFQFTKSWESLSSDSDRWELLSHILPASMPSLFQSSLEPSILASLLQTFLGVLKTKSEESINSRVRQYMEFLPKVPRFSTVMLFLSKEEKGFVGEIWAILGTGE